MGARNWLIHPVIATAIVINIGVLALAVAWSGPDPTLLWRLLGEDGIVEWMQFLTFTVLAALLGFIAVERWKSHPVWTLELLALGGLSLVVALAALEEISWFQRVLDVQSPEFFLEKNRQAETNLHNLALGSGSIHKTIMLKAIFIVGMLHNLILPLMARSRPAIKRWIESVGLYLPPLPAAIAYLVLVALSHLLIDHPRKGELGEMFGATHYLATVFAAYVVGVGYGKPPVFENVADRRRVSTLCVLALLFLMMVGWILSSGTGATGA